MKPEEIPALVLMCGVEEIRLSEGFGLRVWEDLKAGEVLQVLLMEVWRLVEGKVIPVVVEVRHGQGVLGPPDEAM